MAKRTKKEQKKRAARFKQKQLEQTNRTRKAYNSYLDMINKEQEIVRKAQLIERLYLSRPEIAVEKTLTRIVNNTDGVEEQEEYNTYVLNESEITEKDGILYWVSDNNPVMSGLDALENYTTYNTEFFNMVLDVIYKEKQKNNIQLTEPDMSAFELVEEEVSK